VQVSKVRARVKQEFSKTRNFQKSREVYHFYCRIGTKTSTKTRRYNRSISITNHQIEYFSFINKQNKSLFIIKFIHHQVYSSN